MRGFDGPCSSGHLPSVLTVDSSKPLGGSRRTALDGVSSHRSALLVDDALVTIERAYGSGFDGDDGGYVPGLPELSGA